MNTDAQPYKVVNELEQITLQTTAGACAEIYKQGAHITAWRTADGIERLFLSSRAEFRQGAAIRGGVPVIFPQFADCGALPKHGFARTALWQCVSVTQGQVAAATFQLRDSAATQAIWPHSFLAEYVVQLHDDALHMQLTIHNTGADSFDFTAALHTYLRVQDIRQAHVTGLQGLIYRDTAAGGARHVEAASALGIKGEVDRIYFSATQPLTVVEPARQMQITASGFNDAVIWNPGAVKGAALADFESDGFLHMLCVEAAVIGQPVILMPGEQWSGMQQLRLA